MFGPDLWTIQWETVALSHGQKLDPQAAAPIGGTAALEGVGNPSDVYD